MFLAAAIAAVLNMGVMLAPASVATRLCVIALNVAFVGAGTVTAEIMVWAPHIALLPLNIALLVGALGERSDLRRSDETRSHGGLEEDLARDV